MDYDNLTPRLAAIARLVPQGARLADVGTDHAYLPLALLERGRIRSAVATDINAQPLERARRNTARRELDTDALRFVQCDGLAGVEPGTVDTVVIAGLGGENIAGVLSRALWVKAGVRLILQPMTRAELLRRSLRETGFAVMGETLVEDAGRLYSVLTVCGGTPAESTPGEIYTGRYSLLRADPLFPALLAEQTRRLQAAVRGLEGARRDGQEERLAALRAALEDLYSMRRRYDAERTGDSGLLGG